MHVHHQAGFYIRSFCLILKALAKVKVTVRSNINTVFSSLVANFAKEAC